MMPISSGHGMSIAPDEVHLWFVYDEEITDPKLLERYLRLLSLAEREKCAKFVFARDRHQCLVTRALLRTVLSRYAPGGDPRCWQFKYNSHGKPSIERPDEYSQLHFNLSHTPGLVTLAISRAFELGVDVECTLRNVNALDIAQSHFSTAEVQDLLRLPLERRVERFFNVWTLKEAYIKACGLGLAIPLNDFSYSFPSEGAIEISFSPQRQDEPRAWHFWQLAPDPTHKVAVAIKDATPGRRYSLMSYRCIPLLQSWPINYAVHETSRGRDQ